MNRPVEYLDVDDLLALATTLLGDPAPVRDAGLLSAASARSRATVFGDDAYPDLWTKAAALLQSIVKHHPLIDGNKRLGWLATAVFLGLNGIDTTQIPNDEVFRFVIDVAAGDHEVDALSRALQRLATPGA